MSKGKLWGIILFILIVLGFGIWLYTSPNVKQDVNQEGVEVLDDMTVPAVD
ncbi:CcoQ/FixQ family Cbb3-type cytochrome c oxidase assembly chaperone [Phocaeicola sp.]